MGPSSSRGRRASGLGDGTGALQELAVARRARRAALAVLPRRADGRHRHRRAGPAGRRRRRRRRPHAERAGAGAARHRASSSARPTAQLRLSPKAMRQLGKALLRDVATRLSGRQGAARRAPRRGGRGAPAAPPASGSSVTPSRGTLPRTVTNAVLRTAPRAAARSTAYASRSATSRWSRPRRAPRRAVALLVDTSFSMAMDGRWVPMKRTALALHHLISSRFRGDACS